MDHVVPIMVTAGLSFLADIILIVTFLLSPKIRKVVALRLMVPSSFASFLGISFFFTHVLVLPDAATRQPGPCQVIGAGIWYSVGAAWLWTIPYAMYTRSIFCSGFSSSNWSAIGLDGRQERDWAHRNERACHVFCWGTPFVFIIVAWLLNLLGSDGISCSLLPPPALRTADGKRTFYALTTTGLWLGIAYVLFVFLSAHCSMHRDRKLLCSERCSSTMARFDASARCRFHHRRFFVDVVRPAAVCRVALLCRSLVGLMMLC